MCHPVLELFQATFEKTIKDVGDLLPSVKKGFTLEQMILKTIPNLMAATVVEFSKGKLSLVIFSIILYLLLARPVNLSNFVQFTVLAK